MMTSGRVDREVFGSRHQTWPQWSHRWESTLAPFAGLRQTAVAPNIVGHAPSSIEERSLSTKLGIHHQACT